MDNYKFLNTIFSANIAELIFGTSAGIIFGLLLIIQPFSETLLIQPAFLEWLKLLGFLVFVSGLIDLIRLVIGVSNYTGQQVFLILGAIYNISYIFFGFVKVNSQSISRTRFTSVSMFSSTAIS